MKSRLRKKYKYATCKHLYDEKLWVTNDPYDMYMTERYCKLNPDKEFPDDIDPQEICKNCKAFCISKTDMKKYYHENKEWEKRTSERVC